ncbi:hypothetical protein D3C72_1020920 [compost metagenome]
MRVHHHPVAALFLGQVQGFVGQAQCLLRIRVETGEVGHAQGHGDRAHRGEGLVGDGLAQALAGLPGRFDANARQQHQELLAAGAAQHVGLARMAAHLFGDMHDGRITDVVTVAVVDRFETVDIQRQDRKRQALRLQCVERLLQSATVEQAGQRIGAAGPVERADPILQRTEAVQHGLFQLRHFEVPGSDAIDVADRIAGVFAIVHVARQLPQRQRNAPCEPPGDQQRQHAQRNGIPDHRRHQP